MSSAVATVGGLRFPDGLVQWIRPYLGWFLLISIVTSLLCGVIQWALHQNFDLDDTSNEPNVTITASGFLSVSHEILDNGSTVQVVNHSDVPMDAVVKAADGRDLLTYLGLMPGESFCFEYQEPSEVVVSAS